MSGRTHTALHADYGLIVARLSHRIAVAALSAKYGICPADVESALDTLP